MMNELQIFKNSEFGEIRVIMIDGEPWFVAKDIADALKYSETSTMLRRLDNDEKADRPIWSNSSNQYRNQKIISEPGLYEACFGGHTKDSKKFKKWIKTEVLPSIRKTGSYSIGQNKLKLSNQYNFLNGLLKLMVSNI
jgi:prophage antirepressor-like protein